MVYGIELANEALACAFIIKILIYLSRKQNKQ